MITGNCNGTPFTYTLNLGITNEGYGEIVQNLPRPCSFNYTITDACGVVTTNTFEQAAAGVNNLGVYSSLVCPDISNNGYKVKIGVGYGPPYSPIPDFTFDIKNSSDVSVSGYPVTQTANEVYPSLAPGTYTYTLTDKCGTTKTSTINIPNYPPPTVSIDGTTKCINAGQVTVMGISLNIASNTKEYKIISGPNRIGEINSSGIFSNLVSGGDYIFEFYDGCSKVLTPPFKVPPYQQPTFNVTYGAICAPATTASISAFDRTKSIEPYQYEIIAFNTTGGLTRPLQLDSVFTNLGPGQYNVRGFDACMNSFTFLGKIGDLVKPIIDIPKQYCLGETIKLRATQCVFGATYTWYKGSTVIYTGPNHYFNINNATVNDGGVYSVKVFVSGGCEFTSDGIIITVSPELIITNQTSCNGGAIDLTANAVTVGSEAGILTYWTNINATSPLSNPSTITVSGTYYIKIVTPSGCTVVKPVQVNISTFSPTATGASVCVNEAINLTSSLGATYSWRGPLNFTSTLQNPVITNAQTVNNGVYTVSVTNSEGCLGTATANVVVNTLPVAGTDQSICSPATTAFINASTTEQAWTIITKPSGTNPSVAANGNIDGLTVDGVYTFRLSQGSCFDDVQITRTAGPNAGVDISSCKTTAKLAAVSGTETWSVVISPANPSPATIDANGNVSGMVNNGDYQFELKSNGCSDIVKITKTTGLDVSTENLSVCTGGIIQLGATSTTTTGVSYSWKGPAGSGFTSTQQSPVIANASSSNAGVYTVTASLSGCSATATSNVAFKEITVGIIGGRTNVCVGQNLVLRDVAVRKDTDPKVMTYFWSGPNGTNTYTSSAAQITIPTTPDMSQVGEYSLVQTFDNGCSVTNMLTVSVTKCQSIGDLVWKDVNNDGLSNNGELGVANVPVKLYNATAPTVSIGTTITDANGKYLFRDLTPGSYIVEIDAPVGFTTSTGKNGSVIGPFEPGINPTDDAVVGNDYNNQDHGTSGTGQLIRSGIVELTNGGEPINDGETTPADSIYNSSSNRTIDFGIFQPAKIGDFVWSDTNKNGIQDIGELGVSGVIVNLYAGSGTTPIATATTGTDGKYLFDNLIAGTYTVEFVKTSIGAGNGFTKLAGTIDGDKDSNADLITGKSAPIPLLAGESNLTIDAGIIVNCVPSAIGTITVPSLCVGQTLTMNATSSDPLATYAWSTNATTPFTATTKDITLPNLTTSNSGTYTVLITNSNLCTSALTANVVVNPIPTVSVTNDAFCEGSTGSLTASGASSYSWTGPSGAFTTTTAILSVTQQGIYTVTGNSNGCTANATTSVTVYPKTVLTATGAAICLGGNGTISVLPAGLKYAWTGPAPFNSTLQTPSISNATDGDKGTYTVTVTDGNTCISTATVAVTVGTALTVTPSSNSSVCVGTKLDLSITGGTGATYLWTSPKGVTTNVQNPSILNASLDDKGIWTVAVQNADGCKGSGAVTVDVKPALTGVTASASAPGCTGDNILLTSSLTGAKSYEWSGTPTFTSTVQNPTIEKATANNYTFTVKVTNTDGCVATATASTAIYTAPAATATANSSVCFGNVINLGVITSGTKFAWSGPNNFTNSTQTPSILNAKAINDGVYTVVVTNANSCNATSTVRVIVNVQLSGGNDLSICQPLSTAQLTVISGATWTVASNSVGFGTVAIDASGIITKMETNGIYTFVLTQGECKDSVNVERIAKPIAGPDVEICSDIKTAKLPNAQTDMTWSSISTNPSGTLINATTGEVTGLTTAEEYKFILKNKSGCTDTVSVKTKAIPTFNVNPVQATCTIGAANSDAKLIVSSTNITATYDYSEGLTYTGTKTFATGTAIATPVIGLSNPTADRNYTVRVFNSTGCYTDKTIILKTRVCECKADVCLPYAVRKTK